MEFIKFLLSGHLILIFVTAFSPDGNPNIEFDATIDELAVNFRLPAHIISPEHYNIELVLDNDRDIFHGICNISFVATLVNIHNPAPKIYLHSANLNINNSTLIKGVGVNAQKYKIQYITYITKQEIVILDFKHKLSPINTYTLNIEFTGIISESGGLLKTSYGVNRNGDKEWLIATRNSAIGTRRLFPCFDEPGLKANFTITLKYHNSYTAFSNMPIAALPWSESDTKMTRFATTPAIPTYFVAIALFRKPSISLTDPTMLWGREQVIKNIRDAASTITNFTQAFQNEWTFMGDFLKVHHFAIPGWLDDGMNKWQIVFYREADVIYNKELDPVARKIEVSRLIAHKLASQWINSVISLSWWSHRWLHEGIATLLGLYIIDKTIPDFRMMDLFVVQTQQESLHLDDQHIMNSLTSEINSMSELNSLFTFPYYLKGPAILRMLQHLMGKEVFQEGINIYLKKQSAFSNDFWAAMKTAYDKAPISYYYEQKKYNIIELMKPWTEQNHYPILNISQYLELEYYTIVNVLVEKTPETRWIPVTYTTQSNINFNTNNLEAVMLKPPASFVPLGFNASVKNDSWIIFNTQQLGYYRVNYDGKNWAKIARFLNSENYTEIHVLNRAQIIDDAFYFMTSGKLNSPIFWELTSYLSQETDYVAWYPMLKVIERMSYIYPFPDSQDFKIKEKILSRLVPLLSKIGYKECHPDENDTPECSKSKDEDHLLKSLRQEAAKWACVLGDIKCKREANAKLKLHLPSLYPIFNYSLPWWREWTYCHGLSTEDDITINKVFDIYLQKGDPKILEFLACSDNYIPVISILMDAMKKTPHSSPRARGQNIITRDYINMFHHIVEKYAKNESALDYMLFIWKEIKPKEISSTAALIDIINHVYSSKHLDKIKQFLEKKEVQIKELNGMLKNNNYSNALISNVRSKIDLRSSQIKRHIHLYLCMSNLADFIIGDLDDKCKYT